MPGHPKDILFGFEARQRLLSGARQVAKAVATTHGPLGKTTMIQRMSGLITTKDGLTVAREIGLPDPVENMGAKMIQEACFKVNSEAGDGTTATAVLALALMEEGHKEVVSGKAPVMVATEIDSAVDQACKFIRNLSVPVVGRKAIEQIAFIAGNGDAEIARLMADACMAVGKDGTIAIEDGKGVDSSLEFKEGLEIPKGAASYVFLGKDTERVMEGALIAVISKPLLVLDDVKELLEMASQWPENGLVIFAPTILGEALRTLTLNDSKGVVKNIAVQAPGYRTTEFLEDVAALSGAVLVNPFAGLNHQVWDSTWFGSLRKATIKSSSSLLEAYDDNSERIRNHVARLKGGLNHTSDFEKDHLRQRIAKLTGGLAILKVGGVTEAALKERRARVEDILGAVQAALKGGIVPGGGVAFLLASRALGTGIVAKALMSPINSLARHANLPGSAIYPAEDSDPWEGWDFIQARKRNLAEHPLVADAALAVEASIRAAGSVARTLVLSSVTITKKDPHHG